MTTTAQEIAVTMVHPFEAAKMGKAPFRLCAEDEANRARRLGGGFGFCDACGTQISRVFYVRSACGKVSMVGSNCVEKIATWEPQLARKVKAIVADDRKKAQAARKSKQMAETATAMATLDDPAVASKLAALPHPKGWSDSTLLDWALWMRANAGQTGKAEVVRAIRAAQS